MSTTQQPDAAVSATQQPDAAVSAMQQPAAAMSTTQQPGAAVSATQRAEVPAGVAVPARRPRLAGLDGIRGIAALFVVLHHCYLMSFPGYPVNTGPGWLAWLLYGHLAVVVFIALSGFSLAVSPAGKDWQLGGKARFAHRRAWRILPPYWAALVFSLIIAWTVVPQPGSAPPDAKAVVVYGLLLQDVFGSAVPNGAFWSIAVEAQLYLVFPLLLVVLRRAGAIAMVTAVAAVVVAFGLLAPQVAVVGLFMRFTPQFAALFALGLATAGILRAGDRMRRLPWQWFTLIALAPVLIVIAAKGTVWWDREHFWMDLAFGPAIALLLVTVATRRSRSIGWLLDTRPVRSLGSFSYSLYLIHAPIVVAVSEEVVAPHVAPGLGRFAVTLALAVPVSVLAARGFAAVFEIPFQRYRSWAALRAAAHTRLGR
jgi:peptidoglycan/LPS O-acetylase OafA/YrhL